MAMQLHNSLQQFDYILDKPCKKLEIVEDITDDGGNGMYFAVDCFLSSVIEAYGMVGEMTSSDKQQVSVRLAAVKEKSVQCIHETHGCSFDGVKWKCIARSVMDTLIQTVEETRRAQMLRQLQLCDHNLDGILKCGYIEIIVTEFKRLLINTARLLEYVYKYLSWGTLKGLKTHNVLLLCASQLQKLFPVLLDALEVTGSSSEQSVELKNYIVQRMKVCLLRVQRIIEAGNIEEADDNDDLGGGLFIVHMDQALSYLAVFDSASGRANLSEQWRTSVEAVLQHAMSIAQIASQFDFKMIHGSGEKVLRECQQLEEEYKKTTSNPSVCKLHASSLSNALEELEQRVCASVLKMYLQVFSDPFSPLQALCSHSSEKPKTDKARRADDLSNYILAFDNHTDRIIQVAVFAIACSEDQNRVLSIRSCLASLESLEAHLVPALSTFYVKQGTSDYILAKVLVDHWNSEVKLLWKLIDGIVDPAALAQVTHNVIWAQTAILKKSIMTKKALESSELIKLVRSVVSSTNVFSNQLQVSAKDLHLSEKPVVWQAMKDLVLAIREGKAVLQKVEALDSTLGIDRILKRCELIVSSVGHIQPLLEELDDPNPGPKPAITVDETSPSSTESETVKISFSVDKNLKQRLLKLGLPSDAEIEIDTVDASEEIMDDSGLPNLLQSFMDKTSMQPRFMTSFLYNENKSVSKGLQCATPRGGPSSHIFSRKMVEPRDNFLQHTFSLDTSRLAALSETLRCQSNSMVKPLLPSHHKLQDIESEHHQDDSSNNITTPERMKDLAQVQNKIDAVKISSQCLDQSYFSHPIS